MQSKDERSMDREMCGYEKSRDIVTDKNVNCIRVSRRVICECNLLLDTFVISLLRNAFLYYLFSIYSYFLTYTYIIFINFSLEHIWLTLSRDNKG